MKKVFLALVILAVVYLVGPQPSTPDYGSELPDVPSTSTAIETYVEAGERRHELKPDNAALIVWNDTLTKAKTPVVLLYLHGFSASRQEGAPTHLYFAEKYGCNAYLARLSDHGIDSTDAMYHLSAERLWESAKRAYAVAKSLGDEVVIMSTSTGGTLALKLAATYPEIKGLINLSPNIEINNPTAFLLNNPWGKQIARIAMGGDFRTVEYEEVDRQYWYASYRIEALVALQELVETMATPKVFRQVTCPVFSAYYYKDEANQDPVVRVDAILDMHSQLGTPKQLQVTKALPNADTHVIGYGRRSGAIPELLDAIDGFAQAQLEMSAKVPQAGQADSL